MERPWYGRGRGWYGWLIEIRDLATSAGATLSQILIALVGDPVQQTIHEFGVHAAVPPGVETTVLSYPVPLGKTLSIFRFAAWADTDAQYFLKVEGAERDGGRTTIAALTLAREFYNTPVFAAEGEVVTITALRQSPSATLPMRAALMGVLNNG